MRRIVLYTMVVLATVTVLIVLWQFRQAIVLFLLSLAISAAFRPLVDTFAQKRIPRNIALVLTYAIVFGLAAGVVIVVSGPLGGDLARVSNQLAIGYQQIKARWPVSGTQLERSLAEILPPPEQLYAGLSGEKVVQMARALLGITTNALDFGGSLAMILILSLYWSADSIHFERLLLSLLPVEQRARARSIWRGIEKGVGAYIRSELIQSFLAGILLWLGYWLMGLDFPVLLALLGALAWLIPWFGALLAVVPALLAGLGGGLGLGILAAAYTMAVLMLQEWVIEPRIFRRQSYSSLVLVLVILILTDAFGLVGLLLAPLVSAAVQIAFKYLVYPPVAAATSGVEGPEASQGMKTLQARLAQIQTEMESCTQPLPPEVGNLALRLERLIADTSRYYDEKT